jgi:hypothetical protein
VSRLANKLKALEARLAQLTCPDDDEPAAAFRPIDVDRISLPTCEAVLDVLMALGERAYGPRNLFPVEEFLHLLPEAARAELEALIADA